MLILKSPTSEPETPRVRLPHSWTARPYQQALWDHLMGGGRRADVAAHRRWGKDEVALHFAADQAHRHVGVYWHMLPEAGQARKAIWDAVNPHTGRKRIDEAFPKTLRKSTRASEMAIEFKNGSIWQVVGSDNFDSLVGSSPVGVVFSEWALAKPDAWTYIRPILAENDGWNTDPSTTAQEYVLPGGGRIIAGRAIGANLLVWTNAALFLGTYVGSPNQIWRFDKVGDKCGLAGPNAAVVVGQRAFWVGPDLQFYSYGLGGQAQAIDCAIRDAFAGNLAAGQGDKIYASSTSSFQEVRFDYPDARDGTENSRYLSLIVSGGDAGAWARGVEPRTAYVDAGPASYPISTDPSGRALWQERGMSNDGAPLPWFLETADQNLSIDQTTMVRGLWPDLANQVGPVNLTLFTRLKPEGVETARGPYSVAAGQERVDVRVAGRLFRIRYDGNSAPAACRWGTTIFDVVQAGAR